MTEAELTVFEIPAGYKELKAHDVRLENDYYWSSQANTWMKTKQPGTVITETNAKRMRFIRKAEYIPTSHPQYGSW